MCTFAKYAETIWKCLKAAETVWKLLNVFESSLKSYNRKQPTEIQIKTFKMLEYSDLWVAAHFEYKEKWSTIATDIDWVKELKELVNNLQDNDFVWSLKLKSSIKIMTAMVIIANNTVSPNVRAIANFLGIEIFDIIVN